MVKFSVILDLQKIFNTNIHILKSKVADVKIVKETGAYELADEMSEALIFLVESVEIIVVVVVIKMEALFLRIHLRMYQTFSKWVMWFSTNVVRDDVGRTIQPIIIPP